MIFGFIHIGRGKQSIAACRAIPSIAGRQMVNARIAAIHHQENAFAAKIIRPLIGRKEKKIDTQSAGLSSGLISWASLQTLAESVLNAEFLIREYWISTTLTQTRSCALITADILRQFGWHIGGAKCTTFKSCAPIVTGLRRIKKRGKLPSFWPWNEPPKPAVQEGFDL